MYQLYRCTQCGVESRTQHDGDGCHACLRGVMRPVNEAASAYLMQLARGTVAVMLDPDYPPLVCDGGYMCIGQRIHVFPAHLMGLYWVVSDDHVVEQEYCPVPMLMDDYGSLVATA